MIRLEIHRFTGKTAQDQKVAARLQRKIRGAIRCGHTVLVDFEHVAEVSDEFAAILLPVIDPRKVRVTGLPLGRKRQLGYSDGA